MPVFQPVQHNESIFIMYDGIVKSFIPYILKKLSTDEFKPYYQDYIDYEKFDGKTDEELFGLITRRVTPNILEYLAIKDFDFDATYQELTLRYEDIASESKLMTMGVGLNVLLLQKFVKNIFIYTESYDERIHKDIVSNFDDTDRVTYISGDFEECIKDISIPITTYFLTDIELIPKLIKMNRVKFTNILLANYGYNYKLNDEDKPILKIDDIEERAEKNVFKLVMFTPENSAKI